MDTLQSLSRLAAAKIDGATPLYENPGLRAFGGSVLGRGKKWTGYFSTNFRGPVLASVARPETVAEVLEKSAGPLFLSQEGTKETARWALWQRWSLNELLIIVFKEDRKMGIHGTLSRNHIA